MVSVYEMIEKCHLPEEYLPDDYTGPSAGKIADIVGQFTGLGLSCSYITTRLPITLMRNRDQQQKSIERSVRLSSRGVKMHTCSRIE